MICKEINNEIFIVCKSRPTSPDSRLNKLLAQLMQRAVAEKGALPEINCFQGREEFDAKCPDSVKRLVRQKPDVFDLADPDLAAFPRRRCFSNDGADFRVRPQKIETCKKKLKSSDLTVAKRVLDKRSILRNYKMINQRIRLKVWEDKVLYRRCLFRKGLKCATPLSNLDSLT